MKRFSSLLSRRPDPSAQNGSDSPEDIVKRSIRAFCESGGPTSNTGEEVTHLPQIVEATESSPAAAAAAAYQIRKFIGKDNQLLPYKQYNAIVLLRILVDNPGKAFTKNIDEKFKETVRFLLRFSRDPSVQQIMRETLMSFEINKKDDENLKPLLKMWQKERQSAAMVAPPVAYAGGNRGLYQAPGQPTPAQHSDGRPKHSLPRPEELASRVEEARTSAKLLIQFVQTTPTQEFNSNDLIKEFAERCQSAQRSLQGYMNCTDPAPDEQTFQTLIEVCEQLSLASSKHQRAALAARRQNSNTSESAHAHAPTLATSTAPSAAPQITSAVDSVPQQRQQPAPQAPPLTPSVPAADPFSDSHSVEPTLHAPTNGYTENHAATTSSVSYKRPDQPPPSHFAAASHHVDNEEDDDLYGASPMPKSQGQNNVAHPHDDDEALYSADAPVHMEQAYARNGTLDPAAGSRVKDDEPMTPVVGVSGTGWNY